MSFPVYAVFRHFSNQVSSYKIMDTLNIMDTMHLHTTDSIPNKELQQVEEYPRNFINTEAGTANLHVTDASPNSQIMCLKPFIKKNINARVLELIERELEEFDKVSILFLLAASTTDAYRTILSLCENIKNRPGVISAFIGNDIELWEEKLVEALCIIGNNEILRNLQYDQVKLKERYHPNIPRKTMKIDGISKVLYKLFESMGQEKTKVLFKYVYEEDGLPRELEDSHYLELHALYWVHKKYITITPEGGNLSKLLKHLKRMDYYSTTIYHDVEYYSTSSSESDSRVVERSSLQQFPGPSAQNDAEPNNDVVKSRHIKKGKCVIINEVRFDPPYERRQGSDADRDSLVRTFSGMGFDIVESNNLTGRELVDYLIQITDEFDEKVHDCLVVCILTHGYEGGIVTCDGAEIPNKIIMNKVCAPKLWNTIKLLIVQACQGKITGDASQRSNLVTDGPTFENIEPYRNFARFMSTMGGFVSIRHKTKGSWFVQTLCEVLSHKGEMSIDSWNYSVTEKVIKKRGNLDNRSCVSQLPEFSSRMEARVYFPPFIEDLAKKPVELRAHNNHILRLPNLPTNDCQSVKL